MNIINHFKTVMLLGVLTALVLFVGNYLGGRFGFGIALAIVLLMNGAMYFFSDKIVLKMYRCKEVKEKDAPKLYKIIKGLIKKSNLPMPKVYIMPSDNPNAFATGRNPKHAAVAVTRGIMKLVSEEELKGVLAHELSHVKHRDILITTVASVLAGVIGYVSMMAKWAAIFGGLGRDDDNNILGVLALAIITPIIALMLQLAISRTREYLADASGAKMIGSGKPLASALLKLESVSARNPLRFGSPATSSLFIINPFRARSLLSLLSTHPPTAKRVKRLNNMSF